MAETEIDDIDLRILDALQRNATLSTAELADVVGLSQSPCWRRLARLKQAGYIRDQITRLNAKKLGYTTVVYASVKLSAHGRANLAEFSDTMRRLPEVTECYAILGPFDFLLRVVARDVEAYEQFVFGRLLSLPTVQEVHSSIALSEVKCSPALPIRGR